MSKDLQEKSDKIIKELKDSLVPLTVEIKKLKCNDNQGSRCRRVLGHCHADRHPAWRCRAHGNDRPADNEFQLWHNRAEPERGRRRDR